MIRILRIILALAILLPTRTMAYDVLVLMSRDNPAMGETLKGFQSKKRFSQRVIVMSDYAEVDLARIVREEHPRLILVMGDRALAAARTIKNTPLLAIMALSFDRSGPRQANLTGISMLVQPKQYMLLFKAMKVRRVGVVYDPARNDRYLEQARQEARRAGIELVTREVHTSQETPAQISSLKGKVDLLWMCPDLTAVTRTTVEAYANFSLGEDLPLVSFSEDYLKRGAAAAKVVEYKGLGVQAAELAQKIFDGATPGDLPVAWPQTVPLKTNAAILGHFKITIDERSKEQATKGGDP